VKKFITLSASLLALVALLGVGIAAEAAYTVTATMPPTPGAASCQLYMDGAAVGEAVPCGVAQEYKSLLPTEGTYEFYYTASNDFGVTAPSPVTTVVVGVKPADPTSPPTISVTCLDGGGSTVECPGNIVITVTP